MNLSEIAGPWSSATMSELINGDFTDMPRVPLAPDEKPGLKYWLYSWGISVSYASRPIKDTIVAAKTAEEASDIRGCNTGNWDEITKAEYKYMLEKPDDAKKLDLPKEGDRVILVDGSIQTRLRLRVTIISDTFLSGRRWILKPEE